MTEKLLTIRQVAKQTGRSYRTIHNYIKAGKIDFTQVDHIRLVPQSQIEVILRIAEIRKQNNILDGHKTITQASRELNINKQSIKKYVKDGRIDSIKHDGVYFIPNKEIHLWAGLGMDRPDPNSVEAFQMGCLTIQQTAKKLGYSDGKIRLLIQEKKLKTEQGTVRKYITLDSIRKYEIIDSLTDIL